MDLWDGLWDLGLAYGCGTHSCSMPCEVAAYSADADSGVLAVFEETSATQLNCHNSPAPTWLTLGLGGKIRQLLAS